ncbi:excalibur calcium-binding domain-containing protein, partial [Candidatus Bipolaricaulota bacterium]|nr:excalibur calcium-binding domain-containing protein [Candidatus Bipolaricaulota bacterium]
EEAVLLAQGYAETLHISPNSKYKDVFSDLMENAKDLGLGMWGTEFTNEGDKAPCTCMEDLNCSDFDIQGKAQECFEYCKKVTGQRDFHGLDSDKDGKACESLPE